MRIRKRVREHIAKELDAARNGIIEDAGGREQLDEWDTGYVDALQDMACTLRGHPMSHASPGRKP